MSRSLEKKCNQYLLFNDDSVNKNYLLTRMSDFIDVSLTFLNSVLQEEGNLTKGIALGVFDSLKERIKYIYKEDLSIELVDSETRITGVFSWNDIKITRFDFPMDINDTSESEYLNKDTEQIDIDIQDLDGSGIKSIRNAKELIGRFLFDE